MPETRALTPRPEVVDFLLTRRSRSARTLGTEPPDRASIETILAAAARVPDHGKLAPWRFVVIPRPAMARLVEAARRHGPTAGLDETATEKAAAAFSHGGTILAVVSAPRPSQKIPRWEQELSAGAACLAALNAALALGWGANWLSGPFARHEGFLTDALGCAAGETVAGFIHVGAEQVVPAERDRPDPAAVTTWL